jgi:hypothetical protein
MINPKRILAGAAKVKAATDPESEVLSFELKSA